MAYQVEDSFNRSDSATLGTADNGNTWNEIESGTGSADISSNVLVMTGGTNCQAFLQLLSASPTRIDWQARLNNREKQIYFYFGSSSSGATGTDRYLLANVAEGATREWKFYSGTWNRLDTPTEVAEDTWIQFSMRSIGGGNCELYIDDTLVESNMTIRNNVTLSYIGYTINVSGGILDIDQLTTGDPPATNMQINIGDAWKDVEAMKINIGDEWKDVDGAQINIGDAWKTIF